jgi:hypothetical protein
MPFSVMRCEIANRRMSLCSERQNHHCCHRKEKAQQPKKPRSTNGMLVDGKQVKVKENQDRQDQEGV